MNKVAASEICIFSIIVAEIGNETAYCIGMISFADYRCLITTSED